MTRPATEFGELGLTALRHAGDQFRGVLRTGVEVGLGPDDERVRRWQLDGNAIDPDPDPPTDPADEDEPNVRDDPLLRAVRKRARRDGISRREAFDALLAEGNGG